MSASAGSRKRGGADGHEDGAARLFATPLKNDFQWRNLYLKQYGPCTYPPPPRRNPSTTTTEFPKRKDIPGLLGDMTSDGIDDYTTVKTAHSQALSREESFFDVADNFCDATPAGGVTGSGDGLGTSQLSSSEVIAGRDGTGAANGGRDVKKRQHDSPLEVLLGGSGEEALLNGAFFNFLTHRYKGSGAAMGPSTMGAEMGGGIGGSGGWPQGGSLPGMPLNLYRQQVNPHNIPDEIFNLHRETWTMLMDNRAMAWLEREASEKGRSAAHVRRRLLEVIANPHSRVGLAAAKSPLSQTDAANASGVGSTSGLPNITGLQGPRRSQAVVGFHIDENDQCLTPRVPAGLEEPIDPTTVLSADAAQHQIYESFQPFFAVISPPAILRRLRDQFNASRRAQLRDMPGAAADTVGFPLFSQFATWKEAYQHRKTWECTPFSFFLVHDASYNYAHISALYVMLQNIGSMCHIHQAGRCLSSGGVGETVLLEGASHLLTHIGSIRKAVEGQRQLCPLFAIQQTTEDILLAFEQSSSRTTLTMAMHVLSFLTDLVLDAETAVRFIGVKALKRRSTLIVPGMNVAPSPGSPQFEAQRSPRDDEDDSSETGSPYSGEGEDKSGDAGAESGSPKTGGTADSAGRQTEEGQKTTGDHTLAPKRFSDADFEALFDLTLWFVDAATANSLVPIDPELLPARPRHVMHPAQDAPAGQSTSTSILMEASTSLGSAALRRQSPRATRQSSRTVPRSPAAASIAGSTRSNVHGSGRSSAQPGGPNASSAGTKASPTITLSSASTAAQHQYIPGRIQQHNPVGSLVEVFILHESRRRVLQELHEREMRREMDAAARAAKNNQTTPFTVLAGKKNARKKGGLGAGNARNLLRPVSLSPATTLLSTPLIFMATYIRLHGAPWLRNLFSRLFNILRRESVLLYVNRLDLEHPLSPPSQPGTASPQQPQRSPSADSNISPGNSVSARSVAMGAKAVSPTAASPTSTRDTGVRLDSQFYARMERLEDLVSQDILYVLNEFFSALQGKRSTTRLPQGITTLITQFTSTVHLHLLSNVIIGAETIIDSPGAAAEAVYDTLAQLKQKRMAGKAFRAEHVSDTSVSRLIRSIEQYRMAKFILFDCWIIPALNNAVATGFLSESSSMHLRWNIDAFARYLKILVNSPFLDKQPTTNVRARRDEPPPHVSPGGVSPTPRPPPSQAPAAQGRRKRKVKEQTVTAAVPLTLPLPRYITGIYDVSSGSLVHIYQPNESVYDPMEESSPHKMSATAGDIRPYPEQNMTTDIISMRLQSASATRSPSASLRRPSLRTTSSHRVSGSSARGGNAGANTQDSVTRPPPAIYTVMDTAGWEDISSAMKGLNEALGTVGYDPEDLADTYGGGGGLHALGESFTSGVGGPFGEGNCAMRALDLFCRRASTEMAHNVVVPEFEVLPTMAAGCIDKVHEMMTGQHPLVEQALSSGAFPNALSYSPYMSCLYGVLLHPKIAARALDNTFYNSSRFYQHLMRPVQDEGLVHLMSALIVDQDDLPIVDANSLMSLLAANKVPKGVRGAPAELINVHARWEFEARKLRTQRHFLATGALRPADAVSGVQRALETVGPADPFKIVKAGGKLIEKEARVVPMCFDPWWRAMALALCVKAMTVFSECSQAQSESFERWCTEKTDGAQRDNRQARDRFIKSKGREDGEVDGAVERDERGVRRNSGLYAKAASRDRSNSAAGNLPSLRSSSKRRKKKKKGPGGKKKAAVTRR